jgi:cytochrome P450
MPWPERWRARMSIEELQELESDEDPFELFDRAMGADKCRDPYPEWAEARRRGAVERVDLRAQMGDMAAALGKDLPEVFQVLTHDSVSRVLRDGTTFSSKGYADSMGVVMGPTILVMDEPEHGRYRGLIQTAFRRKALARWEVELVRPVIDGLIDRFAERGSADLVRELTFPFPVHVIAGLLGLPEEDLPSFHRWTVGLISVGFDWQRGIAASKRLAEYLTPIIQDRRERPRKDIISVLTRAELDGHRLDDAHILGFLRLLLPAGAETTYRSSSNLLFGLLTHPEQLEAVRADRSLLPQAIEEGLRWEPPLTGIGRLCTADTEIDGVTIPAGAMVQVNLGSANRDESRHQRPEAFEIFRPQRQHMAFAFGPHRCLGMDLARMETENVIGAVLDRLPDLRLDPAAEDVHITGRMFRAPRRLPVRFG